MRDVEPVYRATVEHALSFLSWCGRKNGSGNPSAEQRATPLCGCAQLGSWSMSHCQRRFDGLE